MTVHINHYTEETAFLPPGAAIKTWCGCSVDDYIVSMSYSIATREDDCCSSCLNAIAAKKAEVLQEVERLRELPPEKLKPSLDDFFEEQVKKYNGANKWI